MQALLSAGALCNVTSDVTTWDRCNYKDDIQYKLEVECVLNVLLQYYKVRYLALFIAQNTVGVQVDIVRLQGKFEIDQWKGRACDVFPCILGCAMYSDFY